VIRVVEHALPQFEYNEPTSWAQGGILDFVRKSGAKNLGMVFDDIRAR